MAADWIKWTVGLTRKREILAIATAIGCSPQEAAGRCMEVWEWADQNTTTGVIPQVDLRALGAAVGCGESFLFSMENVGWLRVENGGVRFPNFKRHNSKSAKTRALAMMRKRRARSRAPSRSCHALSVTRGEERREEKKKRLSASGKPLALEPKPESETHSAHNVFSETEACEKQKGVGVDSVSASDFGSDEFWPDTPRNRDRLASRLWSQLRLPPATVNLLTERSPRAIQFRSDQTDLRRVVDSLYELGPAAVAEALAHAASVASAQKPIAAWRTRIKGVLNG